MRVFYRCGILPISALYTHTQVYALPSNRMLTRTFVSVFPGEGGEGEEPPAGYQEDDGGCPEDDEDEEEEEEEGVSGGSSGSPPRSPIPSSTDVEQDAVANERLPLRSVHTCHGIHNNILLLTLLIAGTQ